VFLLNPESDKAEHFGHCTAQGVVGIGDLLSYFSEAWLICKMVWGNTLCQGKESWGNYARCTIISADLWVESS